MRGFKKIAVGIATLIAFNAVSIGCFAMKKGNIRKSVIHKNEKQEKNNSKKKNDKYGLKSFHLDVDKNNSEGKFSFFGTNQNENFLLGKKIKPEKQEDNFFNFKPEDFKFKPEDSEGDDIKKDDNIKIENKLKEPCFENINNINFIKEKDDNKNSKENENFDFSKFKPENSEGDDIKKDDNVVVEIEPSFFVENVRGDKDLKNFSFEKIFNIINGSSESLNKKSINKAKVDEKKIIERISKLLKEPFNFNFFKDSDTDNWDISEKLKFIVDGYKKDILDYFLRENFKLMYQIYIDRYLEKKGIKGNYSFSIKDKFFQSHSCKLLKNYFYVIIPCQVFDDKNVDFKELLKELTIKAKVILGNAAVKTMEDLKNISDEEFEDVKGTLLQKRRHFEKDEEFRGYRQYINEGLKNLKKEDLCYSYLYNIDNFIQYVGYAFKSRNSYNQHLEVEASDYLHILNDNGLKTYKGNEEVNDIQFEEFNIKEAISLANQKNPENIKKEDIDRYMFLEDKGEKEKQVDLVKNEFKKLVFVEELYKHIKDNINKNIFNEELITLYCKSIESKEYSDELRKTAFTIVFPIEVEENKVIEHSKEITSKIKQIIGQAIIKTAQNIGGADYSAFHNLVKEKLYRKDFLNYAKKRLNKEEIKTVFEELEKISVKDVLSVFDYFKKFENFIDTINFKCTIENKKNRLGKSEHSIGPLIYGKDLNYEYWEEKIDKPNKLKIYFDKNYNFEEELKKEQNKKIFMIGKEIK